MGKVNGVNGCVQRGKEPSGELRLKGCEREVSLGQSGGVKTETGESAAALVKGIEKREVRKVDELSICEVIGMVGMMVFFLVFWGWVLTLKEEREQVRVAIGL